MGLHAGVVHVSWTVHAWTASPLFCTAWRLTRLADAFTQVDKNALESHACMPSYIHVRGLMQQVLDLWTHAWLHAGV